MDYHVAICIPSQDTVMANFAVSLANLCAEEGEHVSILNANSSNIAFNRNYLVEHVISEIELHKAPITHILFLDSDLTFPPDLIKRLIGPDCQFCCAIYSKRTPPHKAIVKWDNMPSVVFNYDTFRQAEFSPVGCALIKIDVFFKIPRPWFTFETIEKAYNENWEKSKKYGHLTNDYIKEADILYISEDYYFSTKLLINGIIQWVNVTLSSEIGHTGVRVPFTIKDMEDTI